VRHRLLEDQSAARKARELSQDTSLDVFRDFAVNATWLAPR
jgi:hypothetical protein